MGMGSSADVKRAQGWENEKQQGWNAAGSDTGSAIMHPIDGPATGHGAKGEGGTTGQASDEVFQAQLGAILHTDQLRALAQWCDRL